METNQLAQLYKELASIEARVEKINDEKSNSMITIDYFMLFFLINFDDGSTQLLNRNIQSMLRNNDVYQCFTIQNQNDIQVIASRIHECLIKASGNYANVSNLNTVFLVPIQAVGADSTILFEETTAHLYEYLRVLQKEVIWQPFLIMQNGSRASEINRRAVYSIQNWLQDQRYRASNRCCLLSNQDQTGFAISDENLMHTIAMTSVMQIALQLGSDGDAFTARNTINRRVRQDYLGLHRDKRFFTARCVTVENPRRSLTLQRISSSIDYFSGESRKSSGNTLNRMQYSFLDRLLERNVANLPHSKNRVSLLPIYSVMEGPQLAERLNFVLKTYYVEPLNGEPAKRAIVNRGIPGFLKEFFEKKGALNELLCIDPQRIPYPTSIYAPEVDDWHPNWKAKKAVPNHLYDEYAVKCEELVREYGTRSFEYLYNYITGDAMQQRIEKVLKNLSEIKELLRERIRQLSSIETVLLTGKSDILPTAPDLANAWLEKYIVDKRELMYRQSLQFDQVLSDLLLGQNDDYSMLIEACFSAISAAFDSNRRFLAELSDSCVNEDLVLEYIGIVRNGWRYSVRFFEGNLQNDETILIGDMRNRYCQALQNSFSAKTASIADYDRIDILHLSASFAPDAILGWTNTETIS